MTKRIFKLRNVAMIACLAGITVFMSGCDYADSTLVKVTYRNNSSEDVHLFKDGDKAGPDNKIAPGGYRTEQRWLTIDNVRERGYELPVVAFRNGEVIGTKMFSVPNNDHDKFTVSYPW